MQDNHILIQIFVQNHKYVSFFIYYLLLWPEDNQWHNKGTLRNKNKNIWPIK